MYISDAANKLGTELLHFSELYNSALDHIDLMRDYYNWQSFGPYECFSYCQYPFILSIVAKRIILTKDSEQQMILNARKSLVSKVARRQTPNIDIFFLNINVRRSHLVQDSLNEVRKYLYYTIESFLYPINRSYQICLNILFQFYFTYVTNLY